MLEENQRNFGENQKNVVKKEMRIKEIFVKNSENFEETLEKIRGKIQRNFGQKLWKLWGKNWKGF